MVLHSVQDGNLLCSSGLIVFYEANQKPESRLLLVLCPMLLGFTGLRASSRVRSVLCSSSMSARASAISQLVPCTSARNLLSREDEVSTPAQKLQALVKLGIAPSALNLLTEPRQTRKVWSCCSSSPIARSRPVNLGCTRGLSSQLLSLHFATSAEKRSWAKYERRKNWLLAASSHTDLLLTRRLTRDIVPTF